jgi:hypothetical protein
MTPVAGVPYSYLIPALIVLAALGLRMRRLSRERPLKLERLWITPALTLAATVAVLAQAPPRGLDWFWIALGLAIGGGFGWLRGKTMRIAVDPDTHAVTFRGSQAAMALILVLVAIRFGLRSYLTANASTLHLSLAVAGDVFIAFALGLVCLQRVEMALRSRRLLARARAAGSHEVITEGED